jgi:histidine triad (HIT) family protein
MPERPADPKCIFCRLVKREANVDIVRENEDLLAFNDVNPQAPRHVLIIPKEHIPTINDCNPDDASLLGRMILLAKDIADDHDFAESGYRLVLNTNRHAGQSVFHIHLHLLGGRFMHWPPG